MSLLMFVDNIVLAVQINTESIFLLLSSAKRVMFWSDLTSLLPTM